MHKYTSQKNFNLKDKTPIHFIRNVRKLCRCPHQINILITPSCLHKCTCLCASKYTPILSPYIFEIMFI